MEKAQIKLIVWHAVIVLLALVFWTYVAGVISQPSDSFEIGPEGIIYLVVFTAVIALGLALFQKRWLILSFSAAIGIPYVLALPGYLSMTAVAFMVLLLLYSWSAAVREEKERSRVNIRAILRRSLSGVMLAILLAISFAAYDSPIAEELKKTERLPSGTERFIGTIVKSTVGPRLDGSEQQKETILAEVTRETFQEFNTFFSPYFKYAPPVLAFAVFLILWGLSWFFIQFSVLVGMLIFFILKMTGVVRIEEKEAKAEMLVV